MIDISGMNKGKVLAALYNGSKVQGLGFFQAVGGDMTEEQANDLLATQTRFDYLHRKVMKVDLSGDHIDPWLYDRDNGEGSAQKAIDSI